MQSQMSGYYAPSQRNKPETFEVCNKGKKIQWI